MTAAWNEPGGVGFEELVEGVVFSDPVIVLDKNVCWCGGKWGVNKNQPSEHRKNGGNHDTMLKFVKRISKLFFIFVFYIVFCFLYFVFVFVFIVELSLETLYPDGYPAALDPAQASQFRAAMENLKL